MARAGFRLKLESRFSRDRAREPGRRSSRPGGKSAHRLRRAPAEWRAKSVAYGRDERSANTRHFIWEFIQLDKLLRWGALRTVSKRVYFRAADPAVLDVWPPARNLR